MQSAPRSSQPQFTAQAEGNLDTFEEYISQDNPQAARRTIERIRDVCFTLAVQPYMGVSRPEFGPELRSFAVPGTRYVIFYRPTDTGVDLIHIRHGSQDLTDLFGQ